MISLVSLVASGAVVISQCASKDRQAARKPSHKKSTKSSKSGKSSKSHSRAGSKSSRASSKSRRSSKRSGKSHKGHKKSSKSKRSGKKSGKSGKKPKTSATNSASEAESSLKQIDVASLKKKCAASQCDPAARPKTNGIVSKSSKGTSKSDEKTLSGESTLKLVPNQSKYAFPEAGVKPSTLKASPNKLPFATTGGVQTVQIANSTKSRKAFKVKTSDNLLYRVNPVYGFVEPGDKLSIDVLRHNGVEKTDHLVVLTSDASGGQNCAKGVFESDPPREITVVPLVSA